MRNLRKPHTGARGATTPHQPTQWIKHRGKMHPARQQVGTPACARELSPPTFPPMRIPKVLRLAVLSAFVTACR